MKPTVVEICAGAGGQALGLEWAGYEPLALVDIERHCYNTLLLNRPSWPVLCENLKTFDGRPYKGADLLAGGLPCPPFSVAGHRQGQNDDRNLFPAMLRLVDEIRPKAVMIENVPGLLTARFEEYREHILEELNKLGYVGGWSRLNACDFGVPQYRPRAVLVVMKNEFVDHFTWPQSNGEKPMTVGDSLYDLMSSGGWPNASAWSKKACKLAPTIVGGSLKHGGPDLGPTRTKKAWLTLGVNGNRIADEPPGPEYEENPRLTVRMVARLQGFPDDWVISGGKTAAYRQIGNAFPPPVAQAVAERIRECLSLKQLFLVSD